MKYATSLLSVLCLISGKASAAQAEPAAQQIKMISTYLTGANPACNSIDALSCFQTSVADNKLPAGDLMMACAERMSCAMTVSEARKNQLISVHGVDEKTVLSSINEMISNTAQ